MSERPVFLVGFMGSGKSTLARLVAAALGWAAEDTDAVVEAREGRTVQAILEAEGEARFREMEQNALAPLFGRRRLVVACGGGVFTRAAARRHMNAEGTTVWLDVPLDECRRRVARTARRPLWPVDPLQLRALFERRRAVYALAILRIPGTFEPPEATAGRVQQRLQSDFP